MADRLLRKGAKGAEVTKLTKLLVRQGFMTKAQASFDAEVAKAVRAFQASHVDPRDRPLAVDGVVGPLTWWALRTDKLPQSMLPPKPSASELKLPPGGTRAGRAALRAALGEMAAGAKEIGGNNRGKWVRKYMNGIIKDGPNAFWCAGFVSWCFTHAPGGIPYTYTLGAQHTRNQFRNKGWAFDLDEQDPAPGDIVVWWRGATRTNQGHIGLVHHFENGIVYTIEGNKGNFPAPVRMFDYVAAREKKLLGFGRVPD